MSLDDAEKRRIARAIWSYTGKPQSGISEELGWNPNRVRSMLDDGRNSPPTTDELLAMAELAGVPRAVVLDGWAAADEVARLEDAVSDLRADLRALARQVAQQAEALRAGPGQGHGTGSMEGGPR